VYFKQSFIPVAGLPASVAAHQLHVFGHPAPVICCASWGAHVRKATNTISQAVRCEVGERRNEARVLEVVQGGPCEHL